MSNQLNGNKIKHSYDWLLHVGGGTLGTLKKVFLGNGTESALSISSTNVKVDGDLEVTGRLQNSDFSRVIYEGDSITGGTPQPQGQTTYGQYAPTWANQIQTLTAFDSTTSHHITAVSGSQLATMQARYTDQVAIHKPSQTETKKVLLIGMIGINDVAAGALTEANLEAWFASLEAYWNQAKADGFYLVWIAPLMGTGNHLVIRSLRKKILNSSIPDQVLDANSFFQNTPSNQMYEADRLHLTELGGTRFAEHVNAFLVTGQSSISRSTYRHNGNTYFEENDNVLLPNGEFRFAYIQRTSLGNFSQKQSLITGLAAGGSSIALGSWQGAYVIAPPSNKPIDFGVGSTASETQTVRWRLQANGVWRASMHSSKTDYSQNMSLQFGTVPANGHIFSGSLIGEAAIVAPSGKDIVLATREAGLTQSTTFRIRWNGDICAPKLRTFADDTAADTDATLLSGSFYQLPGSRAVYRKP